MQDKYTNKETMNKGWNQMKKVLDKEMPLHSKGRRALWLWLLPVLFLAGLGSGYALYSYYGESNNTPLLENEVKENIEQPVGTENTKPMAANNNDGDSEVANSERIDSEGILAENVDKNQPLKKPLSQVETKKRTEPIDLAELEKEQFGDNNFISKRNRNVNEQLNVNDIAIVERNIADTEKLGNTDFPTKKPTKMSSQMREMVSIIVPPIDGSELSDVALELNDRMNLKSLVYLPTANTEIVASNVLEVNALNSILPIIARPSKVTLAATSQFRFNNDIGLRGIGVGLELGYALNPNLKLYTGLQYDYQKEGNIVQAGNALENSMDRLSIIDPNLDSNFNQQGDYIVSGISNEEVKILTKSYHYLHVPLGAEIALTNRFALRGGLRLSYLVSAPSKVNVSFTDTNAGINFPNGKNASKNNLFDNGFIKNTDIAASIGMSYYLNRRLAIDASYDHGFTPIYAAESGGENDFNRLFTIGLRYTFSRL